MSKRTLTYTAVLFIGVILGAVLQPFRALPSFAQAGCQTFPETGKTVCDPFLSYWQTHGGLAQQGYPLTNAFSEVSDTDGKTYTVQYFERAVFEAHPENQPPNNVLLSLLGAFRLKEKYPNGDPSAGQAPPPVAPTQAPQSAIVGQEMDVKDFSGKVTFHIKVTDVKETTDIPATGPWQEAKPKGKFVLVKFDAANVTNNPQAMFSYGVQLKDSKGRTFGITDDLNAELGGAAYFGGKGPGQTVQPSFTETFVFVYDIATDSTGYLLVGR